MTGVNPFEQRGRTHKVNGLVFVIDAALDADKITDPSDRLYAVEHLTAEQWTIAEGAAKLLHPASDEARAMVVDIYRRRSAAMDLLSSQCGTEAEHAAASLHLDPLDRAVAAMARQGCRGGANWSSFAEDVADAKGEPAAAARVTCARFAEPGALQ